MLLDYTTNGDVADPASPLSHAALVRLYIEGRWPEKVTRTRPTRSVITCGERPGTGIGSGSTTGRPRTVRSQGGGGEEGVFGGGGGSGVQGAQGHVNGQVGRGRGQRVRRQRGLGLW
ncbi:hypothetical protein SGRIM128S_00422 [Streptomyces griseomycini]